MAFRQLTAGQAEDFLRLFCAETPQRLDELRELVGTSGGNAAALDLSPASLGPLWEWARPRLAWREGWRPPVGAEPPRRVAEDELEPAAALPSWFDPAVPGWSTFSASTLWLVDGIARYLGECFRADVPRARWGVGRSLRPSYVYRHQPVVQRLPLGECQPMVLVANTARRALTPSTGPVYTGPVALLDVYRVWTTQPERVRRR